MILSDSKRHKRRIAEIAIHSFISSVFVTGALAFAMQLPSPSAGVAVCIIIAVQQSIKALALAWDAKDVERNVLATRDRVTAYAVVTQIVNDLAYKRPLSPPDLDAAANEAVRRVNESVEQDNMEMLLSNNWFSAALRWLGAVVVVCMQLLVAALIANIVLK
jgi:hypothetical protein